MSYLKKLYEIGEEKVTAFKQKHGNPLKEFENALLELRADLNELMKQAAEFNTVKMRAEGDIADYKKRADEFGLKAEQFLRKTSEGMQPESADKAAAHALSMKFMYAEKAEKLEQDFPLIDEKLEFLKENIVLMQERIERYEKEYSFLKSKYEKSTSNPEAGYIYESDVDSRFDAMKSKLEAQEFEADKLQKLTDDLYLADKVIQEGKIQDELELLKSKINKG